MSAGLLMKAQEHMTLLREVCQLLAMQGVTCESADRWIMQQISDDEFVCRVKLTKGNKSIDEDFVYRPSSPFASFFGVQLPFGAAEKMAHEALTRLME